MKQLAEYLVKSLAETPDFAHVDATQEDGATRLTIKVAEDDKGKIIGKQGKVVKAIRAVVAIAAAKAGQKAVLDVE